jgi:hypothetical protein
MYAKSVHDGDDMMDSRWPLFFFDTLEAAEAFAKKAAQERPGVHFGVFTAQMMFNSLPQEATKSLFTEKGLVPA